MRQEAEMLSLFACTAQGITSFIDAAEDFECATTGGDPDGGTKEQQEAMAREVIFVDDHIFVAYLILFY